MVVDRDSVIEVTTMFRLSRLRHSPAIFRNLTGISVAVFDQLLQQLLPAFAAQRRRRLDRPDRRRTFGGGDVFDLRPEDQCLLTIFWLRHYPTQEVLGYLFGVSDSTAKRAVDRCLPLLEAAGKDTMRLPDPGRGRRKDLSTLLKDTPDVAVIIDTFEQPVQRSRRRQQRFYSGKKKRHTLKSQVAVDEETGAIVDVAASVPGPMADIKDLEKSKVLKYLPKGVGGLGDTDSEVETGRTIQEAPAQGRGRAGRLGLRRDREPAPRRAGRVPRRKPRGRPQPLADRRYNKAFARRRIVVEHGIGRLRRFQALAHTDRHFRKGHTARVRAVAGLVNRRLDHKKVA